MICFATINRRKTMKKLILILLGAILVALMAASAAQACDTSDPGDQTTFE
jgi:flagellar basal body-associated protein FliL